MLRIAVYLVFIISAASASGGVALSSKLRKKYHSEMFSALLYFQVFIYTFGLYGIWGQVILKTYLSPYIQGETLARFTDFSMLLGLPFLVFAWLMLIRVACYISGRACTTWFIMIFLVANFSILVTLGYFISENENSMASFLLKTYFMAMNLIYAVYCCIIILIKGKEETALDQKDRRIIAPVLASIMVIQCIPLFFYNGDTVTGLVFILVFFTGNVFLPFYISYFARISTVKPLPAGDVSFEEFCKRYEVSPRESEIIREICNGLSNKEISEKLFISLQTVKDHTHRIYIKTNVRSRAQLMNLVAGK
jgi:DNA-binding CsgD family transcriptional regulator/glucan phosphoethanolaminetransferase (alkaline phosphatase superfamily)